MNVVYIGYRPWAFEIAKELEKIKIENWKLCAVITIPEGKKYIGKFSLPVFSFNPKELGNKATLEVLEKLKADVLLFYGWSWIIPKEIYEKFLSLALHPSPLPKYRGGSPLQHQIIRGEKKSAVSIFQITKGIDEGDIFSQTEISLYGSLEEIFDRVIKVGTKDTEIMLHKLANKTMKPIVQDNKKATFFKRRVPSESQLSVKDFETKTAEELYNFIRALESPYPNAFIYCRDGKKLFFTGAQIEHD